MWGAGARLEQLGREVVQRAQARRRDIQRTRLLLRQRDEVLHARHRQAGRHREHQREAQEPRDRREVLQRIGQVLVDERIGDMGVEHQHQLVRVGSRARHRRPRRWSPTRPACFRRSRSASGWRAGARRAAAPSGRRSRPAAPAPPGAAGAAASAAAAHAGIAPATPSAAARPNQFLRSTAVSRCGLPHDHRRGT